MVIVPHMILYYDRENSRKNGLAGSEDPTGSAGKVQRKNKNTSPWNLFIDKNTFFPK
ncbi:hypothetical protein I3400192H8_11670 [Dialister sp. i34-0019-2H8]